MTTPIERELAGFLAELEAEHRREVLNLSYCALLEKHIARLRDEIEVEKLGLSICAAAILEQNAEVAEARRREEAQP